MVKSSGERRVAVSARNRVLEQVLTEAWRWTTFDGENVEALRNILKQADPDLEIHEALNRLVFNE